MNNKTRSVYREIKHHDEASHSLVPNDVRVNEAFLSLSAPENREILRDIGDLRGTRVLDLGCGAGEATAFFAKSGAEVVSIDVSSGMLKVAKDVLEKEGFGLCAVVASAEEMPICDESFDIIYGYGVLHHVDIKLAACEIARILRPGGKAYFIDPLKYNPAIWIYRMLAGNNRTKDEKALGFSDFQSFKKLFSSVRHREYWFFALLVFFYYFFIEFRLPSKTRYWKQVIEDHERLSWLLKPLMAIDRVALRCLPFLRFFCWNTVVMIKK